MKIEAVEIRNFRTLENVKVQFDGYFSSISGKNNAGKTSIVRAIRSIFTENAREYSFFDEDESISYSRSKTQWVEDGEPIEFRFSLLLSKISDPGLHSFIKKIAEIDSLPDSFSVLLVVKHKPKDEREIEIHIGDTKLEKYETGEVFRRFSSSNIVSVHNSTVSQNRIFSPSGSLSFHEMILSKDEKEELKKEQERIRKKIRRYAQDHRSEISNLLGKLEEKYEVELTVFDGSFRDAIPLGINLKDKGVEVALDDWGAGTQNRTRILMSILNSSRIKQQNNDENRTTPIIIIEEPESFLHPSAQAEFGRIIRSLARELEVQIIITTHSPYMLCQEKPESNILLDRKVFRNKLKETEVVEVSSDKWMEPFGNILGLNDDSVELWADVVKAKKDHAVLVEGQIDKEYIEHISSLNIPGYCIPDHVEIIPYGGKDALKNAIMLKFVIDKFDRVFITYDLDAKSELKKAMNQLKLIEGEDHFSVGVDGDGKDCIEGLLPEGLHSKVHASNTDLIMKLTSSDKNKRKSAKDEIKSKLLDEFKLEKSLTSADLKGFKALFSSINRAFK